jgi:uncharacterized protein (TIGR04255 family)
VGEIDVSPFGLGPIAEVPLARAPLVSVLAQVRYPKIPLFSREEGAGAVRERLREHYPILRQGPAIALLITPSGVTQEVSQSPLWRLQDRHGAWTVTLSDEFVSIETRAYISREDFCTRLDHVLAAISDIGQPVIYDRIGVRYINQFTGEAAERIRELVRPEMHGALSVPLSEQAELTLTLTEALFQSADHHQLRARWGSLPGNTAVDPAVPPVATRSWILDLDSFTDSSGDFSPPALGNLARYLAERAYRFLRWAVTPVFDELFSGAR